MANPATYLLRVPHSVYERVRVSAKVEGFVSINTWLVVAVVEQLVRLEGQHLK